jgi:hypothetical protein
LVFSVLKISGKAFFTNKLKKKDKKSQKINFWNIFERILI